MEKYLKEYRHQVSYEKFYEDGLKTSIKEYSYLKSYNEFITYFKQIDEISEHHMIIGINFTYGWMPTIFHFRSDKFDESLKILNKAKKNILPTLEEMDILKNLFNNSVVGTSKLLHFINPEKFAILDSRVMSYLTGNKNAQINYSAYLAYLKFCKELIDCKDFKILKSQIEEQVEYSITPLRIIELVMFLNSSNTKN